MTAVMLPMVFIFLMAAHDLKECQFCIMCTVWFSCNLQVLFRKLLYFILL